MFGGLWAFGKCAKVGSLRLGLLGVIFLFCGFIFNFVLRMIRKCK